MTDGPEPIMYACLDGWEPYCGICAFCGADLVSTGYGCRKRLGQDTADLCVQKWLRQHEWGLARAAVLERDGYRCVRCGWRHPRADVEGRARGLEVNHILPRNGDTATTSCLHHQANLETLCLDHHHEVTRGQHAARRAAKLGAMS